ncbi:unnamed protein product [Clavelina lepadiformis]|uniref:Zinc finger PHD-type domain-containing protein n=1 Tax=Clavelina lepadiformis TaxID=159417 RepID=A0ABP0H5M1_CLALP
MPCNRQRTSTQQSWTEEAMTIAIRAVNEKRMGYQPINQPETTQGELLFGNAYIRASTASNAISGFKECGIVPYNPDVFGEADFAPSDVTDIPINPVPTNTESYSVNVSSTSIDLCDGRNIGLDAAGLPEMPESLPAQPIDVAQPSSPEDANPSFTIISPVELLPMQKATHTRKRGSLREQKDTVDESDNNVDAECFYCNEMYSKSSENDGWIQCSKCMRWAHEACSGCNEEDDNFICELCF